MTQTRTQQIAAAAAHYRAHEGEGVRGWEEAAFEAGARWADANAPSPWISVKESLPEGHEEVFIHLIDDLLNDYRFLSATFIPREGTGMFVPMFDTADGFYGIDDVDYWMRIPPLPNKPNSPKSPD